MTDFNGVPSSGTIEGIDSIGGNIEISNDLEVKGDLTVQGTTTTINSEEVTVSDPILLLNNDAVLGNSGIAVKAQNGKFGNILHTTLGEFFLGTNLTSQGSTTTTAVLRCNDVKTTGYPSGIDAAIGAAGAGEINTASNVGTGSTFFKQKTASDLEFKTLKSGATITQQDNTNDVTLNVNIPNLIDDSSATTTNLWSADKIGNEIKNASGIGEINTASNVGTGVPLYKQKVGSDLEFKTIKVNTTLTGTIGANDITFGASIPNLIDDLTTTTTNLWSASKIDGLIPTSHTELKDIGTNTHSQIDTHIGDDTKHRVIDDGKNGSTTLWSSSKIATEVKDANPFIEKALTLENEVSIPVAELAVGEELSYIIQGMGTTLHIIARDIASGSPEKANGGRVLTYRQESDGTLSYLSVLPISGTIGRLKGFVRYGDYAIVEIDTRFSSSGVFGTHSLRYAIVRLYPDRTEFVSYLGSGQSFFGGIYMNGNYIYVINNQTGGDLDVYELIGNTPTFLNSISGPTSDPFLFGRPLRFGDLLFYTADNKIEIFDISNPTLPVFVREEAWGGRNLWAIIGTVALGGNWTSGTPDSEILKISLNNIQTDLTNTVEETQSIPGICFLMGPIIISNRFFAFGGRPSEPFMVFDADNIAGGAYLSKTCSATTNVLGGISSNGYVYLLADTLKSYKMNTIKVPYVGVGVVECTNIKSTNELNGNLGTFSTLRSGDVSATSVIARQAYVHDLNISGSHVGIDKTSIGLQFVDNESKISMFNDSVFTGDTKVAILDCNLITPASGSVKITGNLTVDGVTTQLDVQNVIIEDPLIKVGNGNDTTDLLNLGIFGEYKDTAVRYTGLIRSHADGMWALTNSETLPTNGVLTLDREELASVVAETFQTGTDQSPKWNVGFSNTCTAAVGNVEITQTPRDPAITFNSYVRFDNDLSSFYRVTGLDTNSFFIFPPLAVALTATDGQYVNQTGGGFTQYNASGTESVKIRDDGIEIRDGFDFCHEQNWFEGYCTNNGNITVINTIDTWTIVNFGNVILANPDNHDWDVSIGGIFTYRGSRTRHCHKMFTFSYSCISNNQEVEFALFHNGVLEPASQVYVATPNSSNYHSTTVSLIGDAYAFGDTLDLRVKNLTGTANITIKTLSGLGIMLPNVLLV